MGEINLNSIVYNSIITREDILKHVTQEEIYSFYVGEDIRNLGVFHSPLRKDNIPSFALYFHRLDRNILMFKDFATSDCGDFVVLVTKMFNLDYKNAIRKITEWKTDPSKTTKQYDLRGDTIVRADRGDKYVTDTVTGKLKREIPTEQTKILESTGWKQNQINGL
jgi:hypothetical protein